MQLQNKRRLIVIGSFFVVLVIIGLVLVIGNSTKTNDITNGGQHVDPFSHETVSNPSGKAKDQYGTPSDTPVYLGFDKLLDYGLGSDQLKNVETAFYTYSQAQTTQIGQVSIDVDHISTQHDPNNPNSLFDINFNVQFDEKNIYKAKVEYSGLDDVRLYLTDSKTGKIIYDSKVIYSSSESD